MSVKNTSSYEILRKKWLKKHRQIKKGFMQKHGEHLDKLQAAPQNFLAGSLASLVLLAQPAPTTILTDTVRTPPEPVPIQDIDVLSTNIQKIRQLLPERVEPLTESQDQEIASLLSEQYNLPIFPSLEGKKLNRTYGIIGAEQHLMRYPGDTMTSHFDKASDRQMYYSSGMAPGRGAWGYFADSRATMTERDALREKYYIAVQTFLSPGWKENVREYSAFFKYRKMLVVNPDNGRAMVVVIGDAGPGKSTGKHLGGSPEVMSHLRRVDGRAKGAVLYFFINDPADQVPLGPIEPQQPL